MKATVVAVIKIIGALFAFVGILAGCLAALLLVFAMIRFPPLLIAVMLACWILFWLLNKADKLSR
jgi:H+/Cl- antiporter ClcA